MKRNAPFILAIVAALPVLWGCTQIPSDIGELSYNRVKRGMVFVKSGQFQMGQTGIATPLRQVSVSPFYIDNTDVTQGEYQSLMGVNPSYFGGDSLLPVISVTWFDAALYCNARSRNSGLDTVYSFTSLSGVPGNGCDTLRNLVIDYSKKGYRLPTEAEWEYACRAGSSTRYYWGDAMDHDYCWDTTNSGGRPHRVGQKTPNGFGLYDMSGNVWQWCNDWFGTYGTADQTDPVGAATGANRLLRGGSWYAHDYSLCAAYRVSNVPGKKFFDVGFRCVLAQFMPPPVLRSPANGATGQPQSPTLSWLPVSNATGYYVQVSTDSSFAAVAFEDTTLTATSKTISGLSVGVIYYWRVMAGSADEKSAWSAVWSFTTATVLLQAPTLLSPASTSSNQPLSITLTWSTVGNATGYHVQVSTVSSFASVFIEDSALVAASRTIGNLSGSTTYYWRVRAKNVAGVSSWTSPWSFTTILPSIPSVPTLVSPANGSTIQSLTPTLDWSTVSGATTYHVQVSTSSTFTIIFSQDSTLTADSMKLGGLALRTTYYWRVRAKNAVGVSGWTAYWRFVTPTSIPTVPPVPTLVSPADGSTGQTLKPTLAWSSVANATSYRVQLSQDSGFTSVVQDDSLLNAATKTVDSLSTISTYYWRVRAKNANGISAWTGYWSFTTAAALQAPTPVSPVNGSSGQPTSPTLTWSTVSGVATYDVQVSTSSTFASVLLDDSTLTVASRTITNLATGITCYWRVRAKNAAGFSPWTSVWSFTTAFPPAPSVPTLVSPVNASANQSRTPTLDWSMVSGATTYHVQVSTSNTFAAIFFQDSTLTSDSIKPGSLGALTMYYWRVRAKNSGGTSSWTSPWSFTTDNSTPAIDIRLRGNSVVVDGTRAYCIAGTQFEVYDVGNPQTPSKIGSVTHGYTDVRVEAHAISNNIVWCVRSSSGGYGAATYVFGIDVSNPANPVLRGTLTLQTGSSLLSNSSTIYSGYLLVHDYSRNLIYVINISNPSAPTVFIQWAVPNMVDGGPGWMLIEGTLLYLPCGQNKTLNIYNLSNLSAVSLVGSASFVSEEPYGPVVKIGSYLYLTASDYNGPYFMQAYTFVINVSNPATPVVVSGTVSNNGGLKTKNGKLFSLNDAKVYSYSLANPAAPVIVDSLTVTKPAGTANLYLSSMALPSATWVGDYLIGFTGSNVAAYSGVRALYFPVN